MKSEVNKRRGEQGFTLMEIMVVVAILALIIGAVAINVGGAQKQAKISVTKTAMSSMDSALERFRLDFNAYPTMSDASTQAVTNRGDNWKAVSMALNAPGIIGVTGGNLRFTVKLKEVLYATIPTLQAGILDDENDPTTQQYQQAFTGPYIKSGASGVSLDGFKHEFVLVVDNAAGVYKLYSKGPDNKDESDGNADYKKDDIVSEGSQYDGPIP